MKKYMFMISKEIFFKESASGPVRGRFLSFCVGRAGPRTSLVSISMTHIDLYYVSSELVNKIDSVLNVNEKLLTTSPRFAISFFL
jgi:hypothetical protein